VILESRRPSTLHSLDDSHAWTICMERAPIEPLLAGIREPVQRCVGGDNVGIRLLEGYLATLFSLEQDCDLTLATMHIRDLALYALGVRGDAQALVRERAYRRRDRAWCWRQSHPAPVSPVSIRRRSRATRHFGALSAPAAGIDRAQLRTAFARPSARTRRHDAARSGLHSPQDQRNCIPAGFSDISHFNRSFRRRFGDTPHGVRVRSARRQTLS